MTDNLVSLNRRSSVRPSSLILIASSLAAAGWLFFVIELSHAHTLGALGLFPSDHIFTDFYLYKPTFDLFHTPAFFQPTEGRSRFAYPPLVAPLYRFFYSQHHRVSWYLLFTALLWAMLLVWVAREYRRQQPTARRRAAVLVSATLSYPAIFLLERGNLELFVWASVATGIHLMSRRKQNSAAVCFGLAAALKLYPILLLGLFLGEKRWWRPVSIGLTVATISTVLALLYAGPSIPEAAHGFLGGIAGFQQNYADSFRIAELRFDHSFFSVWKFFSASHQRSVAGLSPVYYVSCGLVFSCLFLLRLVRLPWQNRLIFLTVCMVVLPPVSYEYTLVHLYVPTLLFISLAARTSLRSAGVITLSGLLVLMLPGDLLSFSSRFQFGQVQSLVLLLVALCCSFPLAEPEEPSFEAPGVFKLSESLATVQQR